MKKKIFTLMFALVAIATTAQAQVVLNETNFPDANFRKALVSILGISEGDEITTEMIAATTELDISRYGKPDSEKIADLTGIEHFTALTELWCFSNKLTSLDVSKNTALTELSCYSNQLTSLDVSKNTALTNLSCGSNKLTTLDVSLNTALTYLDCSYNQLTSLDVTGCAALTWLSCDKNQLGTLDVSKNTALERLFCYENQLTSLDVSKNTALERLFCYENRLNSLILPQNSSLERLFCYENRLTSLDVSKHTSLKRFYCHQNELTTLDLSNQANIEAKEIGNQNMTKKAITLADGRVGIDLGTDGIDANRFTELKGDGTAMNAVVSGNYLIIAENVNSCPSEVTYNYDTRCPTEEMTMDVKIKTSTEDRVWWGYFKESDNLKSKYAFCEEEMTMNAAMFIPANHEIVGESTIKAIRVWLGGDILTERSASTWSPMTLWISETLPSDISDVDYTQTIPCSLMAPGLNEYELTTPFVVNNAGIYVGFSFSWKGNEIESGIPCLSVLGHNDNPVSNSFFVRHYRPSKLGKSGYDTGWKDWSENGCLALQVLLEGGASSLKDNAATPSDFNTAYVEKRTSVNIPVQITNKGKNPIRTISYTITTNGNTTKERTIPLNDLAYDASENVSINFPADTDVGKKFLKTLTITKVNGKENESAEKTATGNLITVSEKPVVVPVVEEFTGTWCGWCPVSIEEIKETHETFGDRVALIALHNDEMYIDDYKPIFKYTDHYPNSIINREKYASTNLKNLCKDVLAYKVTVAEILATATWKDRAKTAIQIETNTKFVYTDDDGQYGIAYVLVEDGLTGWSQKNFMSNNPVYANNSSLAFWYNSPEVVFGIEFNHVAVAAWGVEYGVDGSINPNIQEGESQTYTFEANIAEKKLIQDKSKLKVITLLIDRATGRIINAAQTMIQVDETGIDNTNSLDSQVVGRYGLDGRPITTPQRGLNIVKMSDGRVMKVVVK